MTYYGGNEMAASFRTVASYLESLPETFLAEPVKMPQGAQPVTKSRFEMLLSPKDTRCTTAHN